MREPMFASDNQNSMNMNINNNDTENYSNDNNLIVQGILISILETPDW